MSTSTLFVDLLIIGIQVAVWLALLLLSLFGFQWIDFSQAKGWETVIGSLLLSLVYPIGVFVDNLADTLLTGWRTKIRDRYINDKSQTAMHLLMTAKDNNLATFYAYLRIRIRISRSSALNFAVIAVLFPVFAFLRLDGWAGRSVWFVAVSVALASAAVSALALYTWYILTHIFYVRLVHGFQVVAQMKAEANTGAAISSTNGAAATAVSQLPE